MTLSFRANPGNDLAASKRSGFVSPRELTVIGAGNSGRALSAYLAQQGHSVSIFTRSLDSLGSIPESRSIKATGKIEGAFELAAIGTEANQLLPGAEVIFVATVATAYSEVANKIAPHLNKNQKIILFSGKLGGAIEFSHVLSKAGMQDVPVLETDALFACRTQSDESIWIRGHKQWTLFSGINRNATNTHACLLKEFFPSLQAASNPVERGLTDFGAAAHAPIVLANMNRIDRADPFLFYYEGMTERTIAILEQVEAEFSLIAEAYGGTLIPMKELLHKYYGCDDRDTLLSAMRSVPNYKHSLAPTTLDHRFLIEDVTCTLIPAQELALVAGIKTPVIDAVITLASVLTGIDSRSKGRTLSRLGLDNLKYDQLVNHFNS